MEVGVDFGTQTPVFGKSYLFIIYCIDRAHTHTAHITQGRRGEGGGEVRGGEGRGEGRREDEVV